MIRITVELLSANGPERNRVLGTGEIVNDGTGTATHGNYTARFYGGGDKRCSRVWRETTLRGWPRKRWHPWLLVLVTLTKAVGIEMLESVTRPLRKSGGQARRDEEGATP
jgi:hypothetical protein